MEVDDEAGSGVSTVPSSSRWAGRPSARGRGSPRAGQADTLPVPVTAGPWQPRGRAPSLTLRRIGCGSLGTPLETRHGRGKQVGLHLRVVSPGAPSGGLERQRSEALWHLMRTDRLGPHNPAGPPRAHWPQLHVQAHTPLCPQCPSSSSGGSVWGATTLQAFNRTQQGPGMSSGDMWGLCFLAGRWCTLSSCPILHDTDLSSAPGAQAAPGIRCPVSG